MAIEYAGKANAATTEQAYTTAGFRSDPAARARAEKILDSFDIRDGVADGTYYGTDLKGGGSGAGNAPKTYPATAGGAPEQNPPRKPTPAPNQSGTRDPSPSPRHSQAPRPAPAYSPYVVYVFPAAPQPACRHPALHQGGTGSDNMSTATGAPANGTSATATSATGTSATGTSATGTSATGTSATETSSSGSSSTKPSTPLFDNLPEDFKYKDKVLEFHGGDKAKAEKWLQGLEENDDGTISGLATDDKGDTAVLYGSEFDKLLRKVNKTEQPVVGVNYVTKPGAEGADPAEQKNAATRPDEPKTSGAPVADSSSTAAYPDATNTVAKKIRDEDKALWNDINQVVRGKDGKVDAATRDKYLADLVGDDGLSEWDKKQLNWRFRERKDSPFIQDSQEFFSRVEGAPGEWLAELAKRKTSTYTYDQLFTRFDIDKDGKLNKKEAAGLDQYIEGRVNYDVASSKSALRRTYDYARLEKWGPLVKEKAVKELINDPTVIDRMPADSFDGDLVFGYSWSEKFRTVGGAWDDAYLDDEGGYIDS